MFKNDLTGQKFGRLTVVEYLPDKHKWLCKCDCGNYKEIFTSKLTSLHTKSCGCLKNKYKITVRRIFSIWANMLDRCSINSKRKGVIYYAQKGIKVCEEWKTYENFEKWALENGYAENLTIDRIDEGEEMNLTMLAEICGLSVATVSKHIKRGDSAEQIIELANKLKR